MKKITTILLLVFFVAILKAQTPLSLYGIDVLKTEITKKDVAWESGFENNQLVYKQALSEGLPLASVLKTTDNEYQFKTDRGNYENMGERFQLVYNYLFEKFGNPSLIETAEGGYLRDARLKRKENGEVYFLIPEWDWDKNQAMEDKGEELSAHAAYRKISFYKDFVKCEWDVMQKYGVIIRVHWQRSGIVLSVHNYSGAEEASKKKP
ncbi:hypothetical protein FLAV_00708 [Flavobacteriales bacterium]|nr:hypothetical protein [Flavobacteriales bacterium]MCL4815321.1 hypothetical protein [Flavobacteriales bacterium]WKZ74940.1 MAG: hypothetical protein QY303_12425 [Vicingaceae bacterium]GIK69881.1 MAG: hypothetical protein BroJett020_11760 [Bacteroidota bacterium]CAG0961137.1 hypothetical protein FLAV_00708 [Flavobacteriales bacterium]